MSEVLTTAETGLITADKLKKARELDFVFQFEHDSLQKLIDVLGVTRKIPMMEGTTLYYYTITGELQDGKVAEGEIIPLSEYKQEKVPVGEVTLQKWRDAKSAEAISKSGREEAINAIDKKLLNDVQKGLRKQTFDFLKADYSADTSITGESYTDVEAPTLQEALAQAWGQLQVKFEDDTASAVYFVNPLDIADYLGAASITTQNAFGMNYIEDFLGLGTVIMTAHIDKGTFIATAKQNFIMYYLPMNGDVANTFGLTADSLGLIGINSGFIDNKRATVESLVMCGVQFLVEYADGVVKGTISGE